MATSSDMALKRALIYQVYVRNHTPEGTFRALEGDLPRIRALGTDIVYLMPIHPVGVAGKKGTLGCPYAIRDYRAVNPEYGTLEDFIHLADAVHAQGMKLMIDVVYNHTSPDSVLSCAHSEYFYHAPDGSFGNRFGDWSDVIDLDYNVSALWDEQIAALKYWAQYVDGFRADVASLVPLAFWKAARAACAEVKPDLIWLAETVHTSFNCEARRVGMRIFSDPEGYAAFDMEYGYDIREKLDAYWAGKRPLHEYIDALNAQEALYPANYLKLRCLENHDQPRIASRVSDARALRNWHAFLFCTKGTVMLYAGQERCDANRPSLFDRDLVNWNGADISPFLCRLAELRKAHYPQNGWFHAEADDANHAVLARFGDAGCEYAALISLHGTPVRMPLNMPEGAYPELISGRDICAGAWAETDGEPVILKVR